MQSLYRALQSLMQNPLRWAPLNSPRTRTGAFPPNASARARPSPRRTAALPQEHSNYSGARIPSVFCVLLCAHARQAAPVRLVLIALSAHVDLTV